jgi:hypothetical protein
MADLSTVFDDLSQQVLLNGVITPCMAENSASKMEYLLRIFEENVNRLQYAQAQWEASGQGEDVLAQQSDLNELRDGIVQAQSACSRIKNQNHSSTDPIELDPWESTPSGYKLGKGSVVSAA